MIEFSKVKFRRTIGSSNILEVAWRANKVQCTLVAGDFLGSYFVRFKSGALYVYWNVPVATYRVIARSYCAGEMHNKLVKVPGFEYCLLEPATKKPATQKQTA